MALAVGLVGMVLAMGGCSSGTGNGTDAAVDAKGDKGADMAVDRGSGGSPGTGGAANGAGGAGGSGSGGNAGSGSGGAAGSGSGGVAGSGSGGVAGSGSGGVAGSGSGGVAGSGSGGVAGSGSGGVAGSGSGGVAGSGSGGDIGTGGVAGSGSGGDTGTGGVAGSGSGGDTGTGGVAGGGSGGSTATGGVGGSGSGGAAGSNTDAGNQDVPTASCPGCAVLSIPFTVTNTHTYFQINLPAAVDLSAASVTYNMCVVTSQTNATVMQPYVQDGAPGFAGNFGFFLFDNSYKATATGNLINCSAGTADVVFPAATATYPATLARTIGIAIATANVAGPWDNPTVVRINSITVSGNAAGPYTFDASSDPLGINTFNTPIAGSTVGWLGP